MFNTNNMQAAAKSKSTTISQSALRGAHKSSASFGNLRASDALAQTKNDANARRRNDTNTVKPAAQTARAKYAATTISSAKHALGNKPTNTTRIPRAVTDKPLIGIGTATTRPARQYPITTTRQSATRMTTSTVKPRTTDTDARATHLKATAPATPNSANKTQAPQRIWNRYQAKSTGKKEALRECGGDSSGNDKACGTATRCVNDSCIQTNEEEILNHDLLVGDIKFILPSTEMIRTVEQERQEKRTKELLKAERQYEPHSIQESQHLSDLKEFLERSAITKKPRTRRPIEALESDRKVIAAMDEIIARALPKTESITDIKERIKRKEHELMSLFDSVDKLKRF